MTVDGIPIPEGMRVRFTHIRNVDTVGMVLPHGGITVATLTKDGVFVAKGEARCSEEDVYVKAAGRKIALGRALTQLDLKGRRWDSPAQP